MQSRCLVLWRSEMSRWHLIFYYLWRPYSHRTPYSHLPLQSNLLTLSPWLAFPATLHAISFPLRQFSPLCPRAFAHAAPPLQDIWFLLFTQPVTSCPSPWAYPSCSPDPGKLSEASLSGVPMARNIPLSYILCQSPFPGWLWLTVLLLGVSSMIA